MKEKQLNEEVLKLIGKGFSDWYDKWFYKAIEAIKIKWIDKVEEEFGRMLARQENI